jgi:putative SOS response-associated peptidase YedK
MCGRFVSSTPPDQLAAYFDVDAVDEQVLERGPNYNTAPTTGVLVVRREGAERVLEAFRWGLVPSWADDLRIGARLINARAETVATKPAFRSAFTKRRCLIPADGFYEWTRPQDGPKQPWFIHRRDGEPFAFAGLWETWRGGRGREVPAEERTAPSPPAEPLRTCTIVTTAANEAMSALHDRMPVILPRDAWEPWLDPELHDVDELRSLLVPAPSSLIEFHAVSTEVNDARNKGAHLVEEVEPPAGQASATSG